MQCYLIPQPRITLVYVHAAAYPNQQGLAQRFVDTYHANPPGRDHESVIVLNGGGNQSALFDSLPRVRYVTRPDQGWDIGAYLHVALSMTDGVMLCFGGNSHFARPGWMNRVSEAWIKYGPGFYGTFATYEVAPHINTTGFWCSPQILNSYGTLVISKQDRYEFEHGYNAMWRMCMRSGWPAKLVTWDGEYDWHQWRVPSNIYRRGDQSNCLFRFNHTDNYQNADEPTKRYMESLADQLHDPAFILMRGLPNKGIRSEAAVA